MTKQATITPLNALRSIADTAAAVGRVETKGSNASADAIKAYKQAGTESDAMKRAFLSGYMVGALGISGDDKIERGSAILDKKGFGAKVLATARRTEKQEAAYTSARKALSRVRKAAGVEASDKRGGKAASDKAATAKTSDKTDKKAPATMVPAMSTAPELAAFMLALSNKNAGAFNGATGKDLQRAIAAFAKAHSDAK